MTTTVSRPDAGREVRQHLGTLIRWLWFLALCAAVTGGTALGAGLSQAKVYRATTLLVIDQKGVGQGSYSDVLASNQSAATYATLITQPVVLQMAVSQMQGVSAASLASRVNASVQPETSVIELTVDDGDPNRAATLANAIAVSFITLQQASAQASMQSALQQLESQGTDLDRQQTALSTQIAQVQAADPNNADLPALRQRLASLVARQNALDTVRQQLTQQYFVTSNNLHVFQPAVPPAAPDHPKPLAYGAVGAMLGVVLAIGVVLLWGSALEAWAAARMGRMRRRPGQGPRAARRERDLTADDASISAD